MKDNVMRVLVQKALEEYDKVFLVTLLSSQEEWKRFYTIFMTFKEESIIGRILFLIEEGIDYPEDIGIVELSHENAMELHRLYLTYEFSDRFAIFADNMQYGTIFHYADTGIMTEEEVVRAIII